MSDGVGTNLLGDFDLALGDQRPGDRGAKQVQPFIKGVGAEHREDEVAHEFLAQIVDEDFLHPHHLGLLSGRLQLFALAEIGGEGHHLAIIGILQPAQDHRSIQAAGIGQYDLLDSLVRHGNAPSDVD